MQGLFVASILSVISIEKQFLSSVKTLRESHLNHQLCAFLSPFSAGVKISQDDRFEFRLSLDTALYSGEVRVKGVNSTGGAAESKVFRKKMIFDL